jgi:hypothetical protein
MKARSIEQSAKRIAYIAYKEKKKRGILRYTPCPFLHAVKEIR